MSKSLPAGPALAAEIIDLAGKVDAISKSQAIASFDLGGMILSANQNFLNLFGYTTAEIEGQHHSIFVEQGFAGSAAYRQFWSFLQNGQFQAAEYKHVGKDGREVWLQASYSPILGFDGRPSKVIKFASVVAERKPVETQIVPLQERFLALDDSPTDTKLRLFESIVVHAKDAIMMTEAEPLELPGPRIVYANPAFTAMSGYTAEEIIGKTPRIFQGPLTGNEARSKIKAALNSWQPVQVEILNYRKDGTIFWAELSIAPLCDENGRHTHWISMERDITARKRLDDELRLTAERLAGKAEEADETRGKLAVKAKEADEARRNLAIKAEELAEIARKLAVKAEEEGETRSNLVVKAEEADQARRDLAIKADELAETARKLAVKAEEANETRCKLAVKAEEADEARRKLAFKAEELAETARKLAVKAEEADETRCKLAVKAEEADEARRKLAFKADELAETARKLAVKAEEADETRCKLAVKAEEADEARHKLAFKAEELAETARKLAVKAEEADETRRKLAITAEELAETAEELKRSNEELSQFAAIASHDLQEPLRMVASYTQLLGQRYKGRLDKDADDFIGYAIDGAQRMQRLIKDLLAYSRVGTNGADLRDTASQDALEGALLNLQGAIVDSGAMVTHDALPAVQADASQLTQLFQNLVGNAIKYRGPEIPRIHVSAAASAGGRWLFLVRDNGLGIDAEHFDRIFGMFQRLHGVDEYSGTGIGLAICKKIVDRHGGIIGVDSKPGQGATFHFTLGAS